MIISARIRYLREKHAYSQSAVGPLGVDQRTLSRWENGRIPQQFIWLTALARRYETSVDYILGLTDDPSPKNTTLPEGGSEVLQVLSELSERGMQELLHLARVIAEVDHRWREYEMASSIIIALGGEELLAQLQNEHLAESSALPRLDTSGLALLYDRATNTICVRASEQSTN